MPPTSHYTQVNYLEAGSGHPVLLVHGCPTSSHLWRNVTPEFAETRRVILIDLPRCGLSNKPLN